jgi:hypothetical protein
MRHVFALAISAKKVSTKVIKRGRERRLEDSLSRRVTLPKRHAYGLYAGHQGALGCGIGRVLCGHNFHRGHRKRAGAGAPSGPFSAPGAWPCVPVWPTEPGATAGENGAGVADAVAEQARKCKRLCAAAACRPLTVVCALRRAARECDREES